MLWRARKAPMAVACLDSVELAPTTITWFNSTDYISC